MRPLQLSGLLLVISNMHVCLHVAADIQVNYLPVMHIAQMGQSGGNE